MPLVINSFGVDTYTYMQTYKHTEISTKTVLRNQACAGLWLTLA